MIAPQRDGLKTPDENPLRELWGKLNPDRERITQESCTEYLGHPEFRVQF